MHHEKLKYILLTLSVFALFLPMFASVGGGFSYADGDGLAGVTKRLFSNNADSDAPDKIEDSTDGIERKLQTDKSVSAVSGASATSYMSSAELDRLLSNGSDASVLDDYLAREKKDTLGNGKKKRAETSVAADSVVSEPHAVDSSSVKSHATDTTSTKKVSAENVSDDYVFTNEMPSDSVSQDSNGVGTVIADTTLLDSVTVDSLTIDSLALDSIAADSLFADSLAADSSKKRKTGFLPDVVNGSCKDSIIYDIKNNTVYIYKEGKISFQDKELTADFIKMDIESDLISAYGEVDTTTGKYKKPVFREDKTDYNMDSIVYNIKSEKSKIYGVLVKEGEGTLRGESIKKSDDEVFNIKGGTFTTCEADHPHFYLAMTKAQYVNGQKGKKMIIGPSYLVLEDVPLPIGVPFGFFPLMSSRNSGVIIPTVGEESVKGFYLREGGYYFVFNDYMDLALKAGIYSMGSWETSASSSYRKRYKFNGSFNIDFAKTIIGQKGSTDYANMNNYRILWTHSQDSKFRPGSNFSANVNFSSSNYNKYDATNISDYISSQTNSSISYSKTWAGTPFSLSANLQHSQNNRDSTVMLSLPNFVFTVSRIYPFQRKNPVGKQRWYEKISLSYTGTFNNTISTRQDELFSKKMFEKDMKYGMKHEIPVSTTFNLFKYLTLSPSFNYTERWYFDRINQAWDPVTAQQVVTDTTRGFYRIYDYRVSASLTTRIYGMFETKNPNAAIKAVRHVMTPSISGTFAPDFSNPKHGFWRPIQTDTMGHIGYYTPYQDGIFGTPSQGRTGSLNFSLGNTLEMKVRSDKDSTGYKKIKLLESFSISSSYNFLADSMKLSPFTISARTTLFNSLGINFNATLDPYAIDSEGRRTRHFALSHNHKLVRLTSLGFSFGYSFRSVFGLEGGTGSDALPAAPTQEQQDFFARNQIDYAQQQQMLASRYYDFSVPWNFSFNYNFSYSKSGLSPTVTQTLSFNGSLNLTSKFGLDFNGGFDFESMKLTPGSVTLTRDLHCWQMSFTWVPIGFRKSWSFNIRVKSGMLSDLKLDKSSGYLDNIYDSYY